MSESLEGLPASWTIAPLWELIGPEGIFVDGDWVESKDQDPEGEVRLIQLADIGDGEFRNRSARFLTATKATELRCTYLEEGDLLIARMPDPLGRCCMFPLRQERRYVTVVDVCIVRPGSAALDTRFLMYAINSLGVRSDIAALQSGSTRKRISRGNLATVGIPVAPLREQHRIVAKIEELFSELDKAIESLTLARAQLKTYRQALLKAAFEGQLTADWRAANPDKLEPPETLLARILTEREARYKQALADWQTALAEWRAGGGVGRKPGKPARPSDIQESAQPVSGDTAGWAVVPLGLMIDEPAYGTAKKCDYETAGTGVLRIPNIGSGTVDPSDLKFASFENDERATYRLLSGDLLTIRSNGSVSLVGKVALITAAHTQYLYAGYLIRLRPNPVVIESAYLLRVMESHALRSQIESKAKSTSGVNNINSGELQELLVPVCHIEEQREIVERLEAQLSAFDAVEKEIDAALTRVSALRQSILKQAFSGQLVQQDPTDEPAAALLARLREQAPSPRTRRRKSA